MISTSMRRVLAYWTLLTISGFIVIRTAGLIPMNNGLGTDGLIYASMARDYWGQILERGVWKYAPDYYFQRSLPSAVVYYSLKALGSDFKDSDLIRCFQLYNFLLLLLSAVLWEKIGVVSKLSKQGHWLGFILLFFNVASVFVPFYYPTLTDMWTFVLSLGLFYAFLSSNSTAVLVLSVLGGFIFPVLLPLGGFLYLFPRGWSTKESLPISRAQRTGLALAAASVLCGLILAVGFTKYSEKYGIGLANLRPFEPFTLFSLSLLGIYVFWATREFLQFPLPNPWSLVKDRKLLHRGLIVLAVFLVVKIFVRYIVHKSTANTMIPILLASTFTIQSPWMFFAKHALYFGPGALLGYFYFRQIRSEVLPLGPGLWLLMAMPIILSFDVESRHLMTLYPLVVLFGVSGLAKNPQPLGRWLVGSVAVLAAGTVLLWPWAAHVVKNTETYHQFIWGRPDALSWVYFGVLVGCCLLLKGFTTAAPKKSHKSTLLCGASNPTLKKA